jgi:hypothetical protein
VDVPDPDNATPKFSVTLMSRPFNRKTELGNYQLA